MNLDHVPHPLVEDHYHIRHLIESQEKRSKDRSYHQERVKALEERGNLIKDAQFLITTDFFCDKCHLDFKSQAIKQIEKDWNANQEVAYYKTKCFNGHWCIRLITDKHKDGFWQKSKAVARDRGKHFADTLQPHETGFNMLYKKI